jgi:hypothetical protein
MSPAEGGVDGRRRREASMAEGGVEGRRRREASTATGGVHLDALTGATSRSEDAMARRYATALTSLSIDLPVVDKDDAVSRRIDLLRERLDLEVEGAGRRRGDGCGGRTSEVAVQRCREKLSRDA